MTTHKYLPRDTGSRPVVVFVWRGH